jgi:AraC-like DNA-binding protein
MQANFELLRAHENRSFRAFERRDVRFDFHWHYHPEYELTLIVDGAGQRLVGDNVSNYRAGDFVLLGPNLPHTWTSQGRPSRGSEHRALVVQFSEAGLPKSLFTVTEFAKIRDLLGRCQRGVQFSRAVAKQMELRLTQLTTLRGLQGWLALVETLHDLAEYRGREVASLHFTPALPERQHHQVQRALGYIEKHYDQAISLTDVAKAAGVSAATVVRLFRKVVGRTFVKHLTERRIGGAARQLIDTNKGIAEVAFASGFNNLANFNRKFRRSKGMTPSEFRSRFSP